MSTYLLAESLHIDFGQLLALHEALDPSIQRSYRRRFRYGGELGWVWRPANILHIGIHDVLSCGCGKNWLGVDGGESSSFGDDKGGRDMGVEARKDSRGGRNLNLADAGCER